MVVPFPHFAALLETHAAAGRDAPAFIDRDDPRSFGALLQCSEELAGALWRLGIGRGDRVAVWLPNVAAWSETFFACARIGAIAVAINTRFRAVELGDILRRAECKALVFWPGFGKIDFHTPFGEVAGQLPALKHVIVYDEAEGGPHLEGGRAAVHRYSELFSAARAPFPPANHPCVIFTTSGTTKAPKFVLHDQATLLSHAANAARALGYDLPDSAILLPIPLCGTFGLATAMAAFHAGRPVVTTPIFDANALAALIRVHRVTNFNAPSAAIEQLLDARGDASGNPFPSVRAVGFANFSPHLDKLLARTEAIGLKLHGLYGSSELQALLACQSADAPLEARKRAGGTLVASQGRVRAVDPQTRAVLAHGEAGELEFLVPSRMMAYFGEPQATLLAVSPDGWFRSGDLGYTTAPNAFVFLSRLGDSLRLGGYLVNPAEIESVIEELPAIAAAQVVAAEADGSLRPAAFVMLRPDAHFDQSAVIAHCRERLARFKVPIRVFPIDVFPTTVGPNGAKIQKNKLQERAQALLAEAGAALT